MSYWMTCTPRGEPHWIGDSAALNEIELGAQPFMNIHFLTGFDDSFHAQGPPQVHDLSRMAGVMKTHSQN